MQSGIALAARVLDGELQCRHIPAALESLLLRSQLHAVLGDEQNSRADLAAALELAEPEGFISIFVEEGLPVTRALAALQNSALTGSPSGRLLANTIQRILDAFPAAAHLPAQPLPANRTAHSALVEPLTARELEVLHLIAAGDSNRAIAEKLFITVSAVKKHTGNIFGKLGVSSRTQVAVLARQLNLFPIDG